MNRVRRSALIDLKQLAAVSAAMLALAAGAPSDVQAKAIAHAKSPVTRTVATCSWDHPGLRPFMGDVVAAVDRYQDIPLTVRTRLKARMAERQYDEFVDIERDAIVGQTRYEPGIRDMHFGDGRVCGTVTRAKWTSNMLERGLVYCEGEHCILVPTVCRNVSRIRRAAVAAAPAPNRPEEPAAAVPEGGGYAMYGWLVAQARALDEPGWVKTGPEPSVPVTPFLPPASGGPSWPIRPDAASPVPEAPTWMMMGLGAMLMIGVGRLRSKRPGYQVNKAAFS